MNTQLSKFPVHVKLRYRIVSYRMLTKEPEMLQNATAAVLSAANPAGVRGCTALPQIL